MGFAFLFVDGKLPLWLGCCIDCCLQVPAIIPAAGWVGSWLRWFQCRAVDVCPECHSSGRQGPQRSWRVLGPVGCKGLLAHPCLLAAEGVFRVRCVPGFSVPLWQLTYLWWWWGNLSLSCLPGRAKISKPVLILLM